MKKTNILKAVLESHFPDIDATGQINFIGTGFENDQDARLRIQHLYDSLDEEN